MACSYRWVYFLARDKLTGHVSCWSSSPKTMKINECSLAENVNLHEGESMLAIMGHRFTLYILSGYQESCCWKSITIMEEQQPQRTIAIRDGCCEIWQLNNRNGVLCLAKEANFMLILSCQNLILSFDLSEANRNSEPKQLFLPENRPDDEFIHWCFCIPLKIVWKTQVNTA